MGVPGRLGWLVYRADPTSYLHLLASTRVDLFDHFCDIFWYRFQHPFWPILEPTWSQLGLQNRSKIKPRAMQNPFKILSCFKYLFEAVFDRFWVQFGTLEPSKNLKKNTWFLKCFCDFAWLPLGWLLDANLAPFWTGFGPKLVPKSIKHRWKNLSLWSHSCHWSSFVRHSRLIYCSHLPVA